MRIEMDHVCFGYDHSHQVLQDICLVMDKPGLYCIIGPNGVGKSTLVKCINKLLKPTSGRVLLDGMPVADMTYKQLSKFIGFVPVATNDYFPMTVVETVMMGRHPVQSLTAKTKDDFDIVYDILKSMHIEHLAMKSFGELSAGQHQRVAIARGLAQDPKLLILDEPTANLDARYQMKVTRMLRDLAGERGIIVLMICHDLNVAARFADEVILMTKPGIIDCTGTPEDVVTRDNIRHAYGVDCSVITVCERPHVLLLDELSEDEMKKVDFEDDVYREYEL